MNKQPLETLSYSEFIDAIAAVYVKKEEGKDYLRKWLARKHEENESLSNYTWNFVQLEEDTKALKPEGMPSEKGTVENYINGIHVAFAELKRTLRRQNLPDMSTVLSEIDSLLQSVDGSVTPEEIRRQTVREFPLKKKEGEKKEEGTLPTSERPIMGRLGALNATVKNENAEQTRNTSNRKLTWNLFNFRKFKEVCHRCGKSGHHTYEKNPGDPVCSIKKEDFNPFKEPQAWDVQNGFDNSIFWQTKFEQKTRPASNTLTRNQPEERGGAPSRLEASRNAQRSENF